MFHITLCQRFSSSAAGTKSPAARSSSGGGRGARGAAPAAGSSRRRAPPAPPHLPPSAAPPPAAHGAPRPVPALHPRPPPRRRGGRGALFPPLPPHIAGVGPRENLQSAGRPARRRPRRAGAGALRRGLRRRGERGGIGGGRSSHAGLSRTARRRLSGLSAPPSIVSAPQPQSISYLSAPVNPPLIYVSFCC